MSLRLVLSGLIVYIGVVAAAARAASLETGNGLRLELSAQGRITGLQVGHTVLPLTGAGGFALADFQDQPKPVNLVPNPGFEEAAEGWRLAKGQSLDTRVFHSGKTSAKLEVPGPEPASSSLEVVVSVKPRTRYRAGIWIRREKVGICGAYISERDDRNKPTGKQGQVGANIPRQDGAWLPVSWEITTEPKTTRLSLRADIYRSTGTLWLDDYFVEEVREGVYEPVEGRTTVSGNIASIAASLPQRGLELEASLRADTECLRVDGVLKDTTGRDRAVAVRFALPLDLAGWTWHQDAEERELIRAGVLCRNTYKCVAGIGVCSIYPWSAASGPDAGLSLALPLSQGPRVFVLQHDQPAVGARPAVGAQRRPETALTFYCGLAKDAGNHPSRAPFSFVLYRHDPAWGMRSAMECYYRLFPESFRKRPALEGYLNYANMERYDPATHQLVISSKGRLEDASDFGEGYKFLWHLHGCYDFHQVPTPDRTLPTDGTVFGLLRGMVEAEKTRSRGYTPTAETLRKLVLGPKGEIRYIGDTRYWQAHEGYNHTDKPGWGLNFRVNEDPGISSFLADDSRRKAQQYVKTPDRRPWDATFTADAIEGYMANAHAVDYRREHFATTLVPLTFGRDNLQPAIPNTIWDFHHKAWWPVTEKYQIVTYGNANGYEQFFTMPYVDVPMTEGSWDPQHPARLDRFLRAVNYHKIWRYWHAWDQRGGYGDKDPANVQAHFRHGLAYAIFPAVACVQGATGDLEPHRALYRQYVPAIEELSRTGWEPVPYATATEGVIVERYGTYAQGELHFTLRHYSDKPVETVLAPDWRALGCPAVEQIDLVMLDILPGTPRLTAFTKGGYRLSIEADGSRAVWVGTRRQAAQHGFRTAAATLEKLERLFCGEMNDSSRAAWTKALDVARQGAEAEDHHALALSEELQRLAASLQADLRTNSPVDLAKVLFRLRAQVSLVPVALLGLDSEATRVVAGTRQGGAIATTWKLAAGQTAIEDLQCRVLSPWSEVAQQCRVSPAIHDLPKGQTASLEAGLSLPTVLPRRLLPFLLELLGKADAMPFTVASAVDVQLGGP